MQTGARAINANDDVLVHGKESARVLREVIQVVEEIRGCAEIIEQFRPRTLQITFQIRKKENPQQLPRRIPRRGSVATRPSEALLLHMVEISPSPCTSH